MDITNRQFTIKELRARKNVTQQKAADDLGISIQTYNSWERNFGKVKLSDAVRVADYFGVTVDDIFLPSYLNDNQVVGA